MANKKLLLLKISGAAIKNGNKEDEIIDPDFLNELASEIKTIAKDYSVAITVGGGNIWRGKIAESIKMGRNQADQMGMLATVINAIALENCLYNQNLKSKVFSAIEMPKVANNYIVRDIKDALNNDFVCILAAGTGRAFFTTDTGIALSAAELGAEFILIGKNNVNGVYDKDPMKDKTAKFYKHLTYTEMIEKQLQVMDLTAATICKENKIKTLVFKLNEKNSIYNALTKKSLHTIISEE